MGEELYAEIVGVDKLNIPCRVYAPVGAHADLLPYLVRRLLENGANTSFVNRIVDDRLPAIQIAADPIAHVEGLKFPAHPRIALPRDLFAPARINSAGLNLTDSRELTQLARECASGLGTYWTGRPSVAGRDLDGPQNPITNPANRSDVVGGVVAADEAAVDAAITAAVAAQPEWNALPADDRAKILEKAAHLFEANRGDLIALAIREAGKSVPDSVAELREAVDYLRYYAERARADFGTPLRASRADRGEQ